MNPFFGYPVANPPFRRANQLIAPGRAAPAGMYAPGSIQQAHAWDDFSSPLGTTGVDLRNIQLPSGHNWVKHPSWTGQWCYSNSFRARMGSGASTIGIYLADTTPMGDCIVSARLFWTAGWSSLTSNQTGIAARFDLATDSGYVLYHQPSSASVLTLVRRVSGAATTIGTYTVGTGAFFPFSALSRNGNGYSDISLLVVGQTLKVYMDGIERISVVDATIQAGLPGLYGFTNAADATGVHLENFSARQINVPQVAAANYNLLFSGLSNNFGGLRAIRSNGATIVAGPIANVAGLGGGQPLRFQWFRSTLPNEFPNRRTLLAGQTRAMLDDRQALPGTAYFYRCAVTDALGRTSFSDGWQVTTLPTSTKFVAFVGNSLTYGLGAGVTLGTNDYPSATLTSLGAPWVGYMFGIPSISDAFLSTYAPAFMPYQSDFNYAKNIAVYWEGTNSLNTDDNNALALTQTAANAAYLVSLGFTVAVCNVIDRQQTGVPADMATQISNYNSGLAAAVSGIAATVIDLHTLLPDSTNATNFQADKVHLTATGYGIVAGAVATAVAAL